MMSQVNKTKLMGYGLTTISFIYRAITIGLLAGVLGLGGYYGTQEYLKIREDKMVDLEDSIQNHLVWDVSGRCYFVGPNDKYSSYLIPVNDCNKDTK